MNDTLWILKDIKGEEMLLNNIKNGKLRWKFTICEVDDNDEELRTSFI